MKFYFFKIDSLISQKTKKEYHFIVITDENGHSFNQFIKDDEILHYQSNYEQFDDVTDEISFTYNKKINAYLPYIK